MLVQFKPTVAAHRVKASGLAQQRVATAGASGTASALAPTSHVFHITDGKTVEEKLEQLSKMPGNLPRISSSVPGSRRHAGLTFYSCRGVAARRRAHR